MSKPALVLNTVNPSAAGWDAIISDNFDDVGDWLTDGPLPVTEYLLAATLPTASLWDRSIAAKEVTSGNWRLELSDGTNWLIIPVRAVAVASLSLTVSAGYVQAEVQAIATKLDALLAAMRTADQLAP